MAHFADQRRSIGNRERRQALRKIARGHECTSRAPAMRSISGASAAEAAHRLEKLRIARSRRCQQKLKGKHRQDARRAKFGEWDHHNDSEDDICWNEYLERRIS